MLNILFGNDDHSVELAMKQYNYSDSTTKSDNVLEEVRRILLLMFPQFDFRNIDNVYSDIVKLFKEESFGYYKCNSEYHDLRHTEERVLIMARIIYGAFLSGCNFSSRGVNLGLISALINDIGYILSVKNNSNAAAKHTTIRVGRNVTFIQNYFNLQGYSLDDFKFVKNCLECIDLNSKMKNIDFVSSENELIGKILRLSSRICQMSDSTYPLRNCNFF
jgi:hypothetical protein